MDPFAFVGDSDSGNTDYEIESMSKKKRKSIKYTRIHL